MGNPHNRALCGYDFYYNVSLVIWFERRRRMKKTNGAQSVEVVAGRHIVVSAGVGKTNVEELKWLTTTVLEAAKAWKAPEVVL